MKTKWVKTSEREPEESGRYMAWSDVMGYYFARYWRSNFPQWRWGCKPEDRIDNPDGPQQEWDRPEYWAEFTPVPVKSKNA